MQKRLILMCVMFALAQPTNATSSQNIGTSLSEGATNTTIQALTAKAESGDKQAQFDLGVVYEQGNGVKRNLEKARQLYVMASLDSGGPIWNYIPANGNAASRMEKITGRPFVRGLELARNKLVVAGIMLPKKIDDLSEIEDKEKIYIPESIRKCGLGEDNLYYVWDPFNWDEESPMPMVNLPLDVNDIKAISNCLVDIGDDDAIEYLNRQSIWQNDLNAEGVEILKNSILKIAKNRNLFQVCEKQHRIGEYNTDIWNDYYCNIINKLI